MPREAGDLVLQVFARARDRFVLESTLAGKGAISIMRNAKQAGYRTLLIYVALGDPELRIERVRLRVSRGGHDIPDTDIRRRYWRSLSRAPEAILLANGNRDPRQLGPPTGPCACTAKRPDHLAGSIPAQLGYDSESGTSLV